MGDVGKTLEEAWSPSWRSTHGNAAAHPKCEASEVRDKEAGQAVGRLTEYDIMVIGGNLLSLTTSRYSRIQHLMRQHCRRISSLAA